MNIESLLNQVAGDDTALGRAMIIIEIAIAVVAVISLVIMIWLEIVYVKYNRKKNSAGLTGENVARKILDSAGLHDIRVSATGSLIFGNSYSHYFKKVRLRRKTYKKDSITSLAMGSQKAALAIMDKEGDPCMKKRVKLTPVIAFGPLVFIPLIIVGFIIDLAMQNSNGWFTILLSIIGAVFYLISLIMSFLMLSIEKKAQCKACKILTENGFADENEIADIKRLFRLYNIEYINDIILSMLELIYYVLQFISLLSGDSSELDN